MLVTMVMAFLLHNRIYDNFLELNLDEQHVADVLCIASVYSLLQFCSVGITYCIAMTITNFERHQHQRQYEHSLHAKQVVLIVVGIFSPIVFVLGKAVIARYLTPADCVTVPKIADYLRILLVEMVYPCWLDQLNPGTGPRTTEVTFDSCIKMTVHVVIATIMAFSVVTINWLIKRFRRMQLSR
ncbi:uncharacterized protein [Ptychodera flava]|uniref:uncharacterized protein n=1 Tax=Ptychodera flava TaxID=63121 RepID=UPI00396A1986